MAAAWAPAGRRTPDADRPPRRAAGPRRKALFYYESPGKISAVDVPAVPGRSSASKTRLYQEFLRETLPFATLRRLGLASVSEQSGFSGEKWRFSVVGVVWVGRSSPGWRCVPEVPLISVFSGAVAAPQEDRARGIVLLPSGESMAKVVDFSFAYW